MENLSKDDLQAVPNTPPALTWTCGNHCQKNLSLKGYQQKNLLCERNSKQGQLSDFLVYLYRLTLILFSSFQPLQRNIPDQDHEFINSLVSRILQTTLMLQDWASYRRVKRRKFLF
jgi:hypothetical protein